MIDTFLRTILPKRLYSRYRHWRTYEACREYGVTYVRKDGKWIKEQ